MEICLDVDQINNNNSRTKFSLPSALRTFRQGGLYWGWGYLVRYLKSQTQTQTRTRTYIMFTLSRPSYFQTPPQTYTRLEIKNIP